MPNISARNYIEVPSHTRTYIGPMTIENNSNLDVKLHLDIESFQQNGSYDLTYYRRVSNGETRRFDVSFPNIVTKIIFKEVAFLGVRAIFEIDRPELIMLR